MRSTMDTDNACPACGSESTYHQKTLKMDFGQMDYFIGCSKCGHEWQSEIQRMSVIDLLDEIGKSGKKKK